MGGTCGLEAEGEVLISSFCPRPSWLVRSAGWMAQLQARHRIASRVSGVCGEKVLCVYSADEAKTRRSILWQSVLLLRSAQPRPSPVRTGCSLMW